MVTIVSLSSFRYVFPEQVPHFMPAEWPTGQRFDPNDLTIAANPDGSELKHFPWVPGMHEQHEQLVKFNQHIRKESGLNKDTQFSDQVGGSAPFNPRACGEPCCCARVQIMCM